MADFVPYTGPVQEKPGGFAPYSGEVVPEKSRSWGDVAKEGAFNLPKSTLGVAKSVMVDPVLHPVDTFNSFKDLLGGFISKTGRPGDLRREGDPEPAPEELERRKHDEAALDRVTEFYKKRYGSVEGFKKALAEDPASVAMDLGTIVSGFEGMAGKVPGLGLAKAVDPAKALGAAAKIPGAAGNVGAEVLGHLTGGGPEAVKQAVKAGYNKELEFLASIDGKLPLEDTVKWASGAVRKMRQERNTQYQTAMKALNGQLAEPIDFNKILHGWQEAQKTGHFEGDFALSKRTEGLDREVLDVLDDFYQRGQTNPKYFTAEGLDALKKRIGSIKDNIPFDKRVDRKYVGDLYSHIGREIEKQAPVYKKIMKDYSVASEGLEEIEKALSLGDKTTYDAGIRKLLSGMRNNASTNYGNRLKMLDALEEHGAKGLKSALAGAQMSSAFPRGLAGGNPLKTGLAGLFKPGILAALPFESPKLVGKGLYKGGELAGEARDLLKSTIIPDESMIPNLSPEMIQRLIYLQGRGKDQ